MSTAPTDIINILEAGAAWANLPMAEQIAMRAIARRLAAMAKDGTSAEDWHQLAGYAEWAMTPKCHGAPVPSRLTDATVSGQWRAWEGKGWHPTGEAHITVRLRASNAEMTGRAGTFIWEHDGTGRDIIAYRHED